MVYRMLGGLILGFLLLEMYFSLLGALIFIVFPVHGFCQLLILPPMESIYMLYLYSIVAVIFQDGLSKIFVILVLCSSFCCFSFSACSFCLYLALRSVWFIVCFQ
ncbi:hypothetical protein IHE45_09G000600 [Dioscorea alata]|uniref:Uncharacterized protein n=1 Tax=Dioscorea alata TaxID=55571 RepID=A0ACB7VCI0_DIOAL|nr:hypothetical protein IHE45_09G000600 [Dioscorea alata]